MKVGFINLGCAKNRVDTEVMMGLVKKAGHQLVDKVEQAEAVIINTCGFISEAQEEAIANEFRDLLIEKFTDKPVETFIGNFKA